MPGNRTQCGVLRANYVGGAIAQELMLPVPVEGDESRPSAIECVVRINIAIVRMIWLRAVTDNASTPLS